MTYKEMDIIVNTDGEVSQIDTILFQNKNNLKYRDHNNDTVIVNKEFIELAEDRRAKLLEAATENIKPGDSVQIQLENGSWQSGYNFVEVLPDEHSCNYIVFDCEYKAVKNIRLVDKKLIDLEREMCL